MNTSEYKRQRRTVRRAAEFHWKYRTAQKKNEREGWKNEIRAQARGIGKWRCHPSVTEFPALKKLAVYIVSNPTAVGEKVTVKSGQRKINRWPMGSFSDSVDVESEVAENESQIEKRKK